MIEEWNVDDNDNDNDNDKMNAERIATPHLLAGVVSDLKLLARKELELATTEARKDLAEELNMTKFLLIAAVSALLAVNLLVMCLVLLVAPQYEPLAAILGALLFALVAAFSWRKGWQIRVRKPLNNTLEQLSEDMRWVRKLS